MSFIVTAVHAWIEAAIGAVCVSHFSLLFMSVFKNMGRPISRVNMKLLADNLTLNEAVDLAENRPPWRLMSMYSYAPLEVHARKEEEFNTIFIIFNVCPVNLESYLTKKPSFLWHIFLWLRVPIFENS